MILTCLSVVSAYPFLLYLWKRGSVESIGVALPAREYYSLLQGEFLLILGASLFSALAGRFFSLRYGLAGLGSWSALKKDLPRITGLALILIPVFLYALDPVIFNHHRLLYPRELWAAAAVTLKSSVFEEVVLRYGVITILAGLIRRPVLAVILGTLFATMLGVRSGVVVGIQPGISFQFFLMLVVSFGLNLFYGFLYSRRGLYTSMAAHLLIDLKYPLAAMV